MGSVIRENNVAQLAVETVAGQLVSFLFSEKGSHWSLMAVMAVMAAKWLLD